MEDDFPDIEGSIGEFDEEVFGSTFDAWDGEDDRRFALSFGEVKDLVRHLIGIEGEVVPDALFFVGDKEVGDEGEELGVMSLVLFLDLGEDFWGYLEPFEFSVDDERWFLMEAVAGVMFAVEAEFFSVVSDEVGIGACAGVSPSDGAAPSVGRWRRSGATD